MSGKYKKRNTKLISTKDIKEQRQIPLLYLLDKLNIDCKHFVDMLVWLVESEPFEKLIEESRKKGQLKNAAISTEFYKYSLINFILNAEISSMGFDRLVEVYLKQQDEQYENINDHSVPDNASIH